MCEVDVNRGNGGGGGTEEDETREERGEAEPLCEGPEGNTAME